MQAYADCRTVGAIGSAYATGHKDMTCCVGNSSGGAADPPPSGNTDTQVLLKMLLTRCELKAARDCTLCRNGCQFSNASALSKVVCGTC